MDFNRKSIKRLEAKLADVGKTLPGYDKLVAIKGIASLSAVIFLVNIGDIRRVTILYDRYLQYHANALQRLSFPTAWRL